MHINIGRVQIANCTLENNTKCVSEIIRNNWSRKNVQIKLIEKNSILDIDTLFKSKSKRNLPHLRR